MLIIKNDRKLKKFSEKVYMQAPEKTLKAATEEKISKKQKSKDLIISFKNILFRVIIKFLIFYNKL
jgi:hypothetical protein